MINELIRKSIINHHYQLKLIHSVIGSTQDFDSCCSGSSPDESTKNCFDGVMVASQSPKLMVLVRIQFGVQEGE